MSDLLPSHRNFDLALPPLTLECGLTPAHHVVRGWWAGPATDLSALEALSTLHPPTSAPHRPHLPPRCSDAPPGYVAPAAGLDSTVPTILVVHALTGDANAGGPGGWWEPVIGRDRAIDPTRCRVLCFNNLGSCYGSSGPLTPGFPARGASARFSADEIDGKGAFPVADPRLPAPVTTWDQARSILLALDHLGVGRLEAVVGGSIGAMIAMALAALAPDRVGRLIPFAGSEAASPWIIAFNHVGRQAILSDPGFPRDAGRGLELARQLAHVTYRAEPGLMLRQGRECVAGVEDQGGWSPLRPYAVQTYLQYQGQKLRERFDPLAYVLQLDAMDHHDLARPPAPPQPQESWPWERAVPEAPAGEPPAARAHLAPVAPADSWGLRRISAPTLCVGIDTDQLYLPVQMRLMAERLRWLGVAARYAEIRSPHGHDAFLLEWDQVDALLREGLAMAPAWA